MSNTIYTPITLWEDFKIELPVSECIAYETEDENGIIFKKVYISGKNTEKGQVAIYGNIAYDKKNKKMPGLLILPNYSKTADENTVKFFAKQGYFALMIDYGGFSDKKDAFTKYPEDISYANAPNDKDCIHKITDDVKCTCWYEWVIVARYAFYFLKNNQLISNVGAIGKKHGATILWQLSALEEELTCMCAELSAGWRSYRNYYKFSDNPEPQFTEDDYKYLGGVEPQTYAQYVKCPTLMLSCTNNNYFDVDRAFDTISRINKKYYTAINYAVQSERILDYNCVNDILIFFNKFLKKEKIDLPLEADISADIIDNSIHIKAKFDKSNMENITVFASEETINPSERCWNTLPQKIAEDEEGFIYKYLPYNKSKIVFFFAIINYKNGFSLATRIVSKKFEEKEIVNDNKSNIIYSSRENHYLMEPVLDSSDDVTSLILEKKNQIEIKEGAFSINGITAKKGIISKKMNNQKDLPEDTSILMLDVYSKEDNELTVTFVENLDDGKKLYSVSTPISGGEVWHNYSFPINKFKTSEGIVLKSYKNITSIIFKCEKEYLLNNILWV